MKKYGLLFISLVILASCSSPKYTYYFDHYDYNSGKKKTHSKESVGSVEQSNAESVLVIDDQTLVASTQENEMYVAKPAPTISKEEAVAKINSMSKEERKELKKEVKKFVKENKKEIKSGKSSKQLDNDVKLAAVFGAVGIVLLIIGGEVIYILGAVALLIGLYFFIRWLINQ